MIDKRDERWKYGNEINFSQLNILFMANALTRFRLLTTLAVAACLILVWIISHFTDFFLPFKYYADVIGVTIYATVILFMFFIYFPRHAGTISKDGERYQRSKVVFDLNYELNTILIGSWCVAFLIVAIGSQYVDDISYSTVSCFTFFITTLFLWFMSVDSNMIFEMEM